MNDHAAEQAGNKNQIDRKAILVAPEKSDQQEPANRNKIQEKTKPSNPPMKQNNRIDKPDNKPENKMRENKVKSPPHIFQDPATRRMQVPMDHRPHQDNNNNLQAPPRGNMPNNPPPMKQDRGPGRERKK